LSGLNKQTDKNRVLNTVLNTVRIVKSFSVKPEKCNTLKAFIEFCEREHITFSDGILWALEEFLQRHTPYNPQPTLDRMFQTGMPAKPNTLCFVPSCRAKAKFQLTLKNFNGKTDQQVHEYWLQAIALGVFALTFTILSLHDHKKWKNKRKELLGE